MKKRIILLIFCALAVLLPVTIFAQDNITVKKVQVENKIIRAMQALKAQLKPQGKKPIRILSPQPVPVKKEQESNIKKQQEQTTVKKENMDYAISNSNLSSSGSNESDNRFVKKQEVKIIRSSSVFDNLKIPNYIHVYPEEKAYVPISSIDINRFVCEKGKVVGLYYSRDKGIITKKAGSSLYIRILPDSFAFRHPFEMYIECGDEGYRETYPMILMGRRISTRTVVLHAVKTKNLEKYYKKDTRTDMIVKLVKAAYKEVFPEDFTVKRVFKEINPISFGIPKGYVSIIKYLEVDTGKWYVDIYMVHANKNITLKESQFVKENTVAVSVITPVLYKGRYSKVVIIREKMIKN